MNPAEDYILKQPEPFKSILLQVQVLVETTLTDFDLLYKWRLPFYFSEGKPICYLNVTKGYVDVCFWLSDNFVKQYPQLISKNRKLVSSLRYTAIDQIDAAIIIACVKEANRTKKEGFKAR